MPHAPVDLDPSVNLIGHAAITEMIKLQFTTITDKGNNKITELRTILQRESQNSFLLLGAVKNQISVGPGYLLDP
jgi:hypothetical protein